MSKLHNKILIIAIKTEFQLHWSSLLKEKPHIIKQKDMETAQRERQKTKKGYVYNESKISHIPKLLETKKNAFYLMQGAS